MLSTVALGVARAAAPSESEANRDGAKQVVDAASDAYAYGTDKAQRPDDGKLHVIVFGAHPDDCEIRAGGTAALWSQRGDRVKFVSVTNGDIGHTEMAGGPLAIRRNAEVQAVAKLLGITSEVLDIHDGELMPTLENRRTMTKLIRQWDADVVIGHRPNDYHPDHRYVGVLMQDSAFMVTVPYFCPDVPPLDHNPVFLYMHDKFQRPNPFRPDVAVSIDSVIKKQVEAMVLLESQFVEGGAVWQGGPISTAPKWRETRRREVEDRFRKRFAGVADECRDKLIELYGEEAGRKVKYAEAFEICEYGRQPTADELRRIFPVVPKKP